MTTELLTDLGHTREDMRLMEQAVNVAKKNPEIPIPPTVIEAMPKIAGTILLKGNHREQLRAGALLLAFMEYNKSLNPPQAQPQTTINVGVQVDNGNTDRRSRFLEIAERVRAERILRGAATGRLGGNSPAVVIGATVDVVDTEESAERHKPIRKGASGTGPRNRRDTTGK